MDVEKLRNLTDAELTHQQRELNDQLFRMKFQLKMGQTESLNKLRGLRKDVARIKTIMREKELGLAPKRRRLADGFLVERYAVDVIGLCARCQEGQM